MGCAQTSARLIKLGLGAADARAHNNWALRLASENNDYEVVARLLELGVEPTPAALRSLTAYACEDDDEDEDDDDDEDEDEADDERKDRLRRAIERWRETPELAAAKAALTPTEQEEWEAVASTQWSIAD